MPRLPCLPGWEIVRALKRLGFVPARQRGSHIVMVKTTSEGKIGCVVPLHDEVAIGTLRSILKQSKVSLDEFLKSIK